VSKDRFLDEVWRGVPVTDEALTQCIRTLRKLLGDDAGRPQFIETVPKHGYRFIAPVDSAAPPIKSEAYSWREFALLGAAGTVGAGIAGVIGGLVYGFAGASQPLQPGMGAVSVMLVLLCLTTLVALIGGVGVSFGIAAAGFAGNRPQWVVAGGALGGLVVGALGKLLGLDAFNLLVGQSPGDITGPLEGLVLGGTAGLATALAARAPQLRQGLVAAAAVGAIAGMIIPLAGGHLMGGSLDLLADQFPHSRLRLDRLGMLLGETQFGPLTQMVTGALEGASFCVCVAAGLILGRRSLKGR
jgi:hypothetical protein